MPADDLKKRLAPRAANIQRALRSRKIGEQDLDQLLMRPDWRNALYTEIQKVDEPALGVNVIAPPIAPALPSFPDITDEPTSWWNPRQLLTQYTIATYLEEREREPHEGEPANPHEQIVRIYDAFCLELLAGWQVCGRSAGQSLLDSLTTTGIEASRIYLLSAFKELFGLLSTTDEDGRRTILLRVVGDVDGIAVLAEPPAETWTLWLRWLGQLKKLVADHRTAEAKALATTTRDPLDWLYDPDLLEQIAGAATCAMAADPAREVAGAQPSSRDDLVRSLETIGERAYLPYVEHTYGREAGPSRRSADATKDDADARTLVQNQRRLMANATQILGDPVEGESLAEELWWRSFDLKGEVRAAATGEPAQIWSALDVATFCLGPERATWLTTGEIDPARRRVKSACVGSKRSEAPSVVIFGAGIAGLTAAHELAERGIAVTVVDAVMPDSKKLPEMPTNIGGMARTQWTHASAWPGPDESRSDHKPAAALFPGEHGYRLFPSFYRHIFDTMKRTPILGVDLDVRWKTGEHVERPSSFEVSPEQLGIRPTAFDQLQATHQQVFAKRGQFVPLRRDRPRSLEAFRTEYMNLHDGLRFPKRDMARFFFKLLRYLMTCSERRAAEYETQSLMAFFDPSLYSEGFIAAIHSAPQALVAMDAELCDARTQGNVYLQLLLDQILGSEYTDSTLRGPTSEAWFKHWYRYLDSLNVKFVNAELIALNPARDSTTDPRAATRDPPPPGAPPPGARRRKRKRHAWGHHGKPFEVVFRTAPDVQGSHSEQLVDLEDKIEKARYIVVALDAVSAERVTRSWESAGVPFDLRGYASYVTEKLDAHLARYDLVITFNESRSHDDAEGVMRSLLDHISVAKDDRTRRPLERSAFRNLYRATGQVPIPPGDVDEIQIALWFAHAAGEDELRAIERVLVRLVGCDGSVDVRLLSDRPTWVDTPTTITTPRMPDDVFGEHATDRFQTFMGIQYYFAHDFKLVRGHVYLPDTEWGLSAISQGQFWPRSSLPDRAEIRGILSIDIGNCRRKSSYMHRTVMECTREDIAREVWRQFCDSLRSTRGQTSIVTSLPLPEPLWYHVDDNLVFTRDRGALRSNRTPFLVNNAGDWERRPRCQPWVPGRPIVVDAPRTDATDVWQAPHGGYRVHADKVVFCGTYMRTFTRMTTMEAANESARHAVNAILDHMAAKRTDNDRSPVAGDYCDIWDLEEYELDDLAFFKRIDKLLFEAGKPHIADILQFDKIADLQYPEASPIQALVAALGSTVKADWGITSTELVTGLNGLVQSAKQVVGGIAGAAGEQPLLKLLGMLGLGKSGPPPKGS